MGLYADQTEDIVKAMRNMVQTMIGGQWMSEPTCQEVSNQRRFGGIGINIATLKEQTEEIRQECIAFTEQLRVYLINQGGSRTGGEVNVGYKRMKEKNRRAINQTQIDSMPRKEDRRRREENSMKGTGTWLSAPPTIASGHYLTKAEFEDAIRIRIGLEPRGMAERCACGSKNNTSHARSCHLGGYVNRRHKRIYIPTRCLCV